jgi:hypothetical protein
VLAQEKFFQPRQAEPIQHDRWRISVSVGGSNNPPVLIETIAVTGQVVTVSWSAIPGTAYCLQWNATRNANTWTNLPGQVIAPGPVATKQDSLAGNVRRCYRVILAS